MKVYSLSVAKFVFRFLFVFVNVCVFSSCSSTYIYSTLNNTNERIEKTEKGDFVYENDSLWIAYSFKGEYSPIQITIFNKIDKPLFIDWNKSLIVFNGVQHAYKRANVVFKGNRLGESYRNESVMPVGEVEMKLAMPQHITIVPPQIVVSYVTFDLAIDLGQYRKSKLEDVVLKDSKGKSKKMKGLTFDYVNSPIQFTSYITTYYDDPKQAKSYVSDFYMSNVMKTNMKPEKIAQDISDRGDIIMYERKPSYTFWKSLGKGAAATGLTITTIAVDAYLNKDE